MCEADIKLECFLPCKECVNVILSLIWGFFSLYFCTEVTEILLSLLFYYCDKQLNFIKFYGYFVFSVADILCLTYI